MDVLNTFLMNSFLDDSVLISVIIPSYKPQEYLWECLRSLETQTLPKDNFEIILILNGCKEPYYSKIQEYTAQSSLNINFMQTDIGGVSYARNIGLDSAQGEYIAFIDDDDYVSPFYLEELLSKASPDAISLCYPYAFNDGEKSQLEYYITDVYTKCSMLGKQHFSYKVRRYFNGPCMKLIHRSFIQEKRFDTRFKNGEDSLFMFAISDKFRYVDFTNKDAIYYRRFRDNSAVTSKKTIKYHFKNTVLLMVAYIATYIESPYAYKFTFFINYQLANIKNLFTSFYESVKSTLRS